MTTEAELKMNRKNQYDDDGYDEGEEVEKHLVAKYYFGLADGVSANRLRGYDAKLFPTALLSACTHFIDKLKDINIHSSSPSSELVEQNEKKIIFKSYENEQKQEEVEELEDNWDNDDEFEQEDRNEVNNELEQKQIEYKEEEENDCINLNRILMNAHNLVQQNKVYGSSTVCLLSLEFYDANKSYVGLLSSCNLGDSGYMLIRDYKVTFF